MNFSRILVTRDNLVKLEVDAIVNAANTRLLGGGGVDGAIHRAAGPGLLEECRALQGCKAGQAKITGGHKLPARRIIHTVGPIWNGGKANEPELLASCYRNCLQLAKEHELKQIAFPAISCGSYRYPVDQAVQIAVATAAGFLKQHSMPETVIFCCFEENVYQEYQKRVSEMAGEL